MTLSQRLFHQFTVKDHVPEPARKGRGQEADEASDQRWIERMEGRLDYRGKTVADLGCGGGTLCARAAREGAASVTGVDLEVATATAMVRERHPDLAERIEFVQTAGDLAEIAGRRFDLVTSKDSMEHFDDPEGFIDLIAPLVRPGGELAIGFSPLWKSPKGGHIDYMTKLPWAHLIFPESAIMAERRRFHPDDDAKTFGEVGGGLNKMTLARFEAIMAGTDLEPIYFSAGPADRPVLKAMRQIAKVPPLREYFTVGVYSIWRKPKGNN